MLNIKTAFAALGLSGLLALSATPAAGATCGQFTVDPALSCQDGIDVNDSSSDVGTLFPPSDWTLIDKDEKLVGDPGAELPWIEADFYLTDAAGNPFDPGNDNSGYFYISNSLLAAYDQFVLVLKGGNETPRWAAFLIDVSQLVADDGYMQGTWSTVRNSLSHATLYVRGESMKVPEPAPLALLGFGLVGLAASRRRKQ